MGLIASNATLALKLALCFFRIIFASWLLLFWRQNYILASGPNLGVHHTGRTSTTKREQLKELQQKIDAGLRK